MEWETPLPDPAYIEVHSIFVEGLTVRIAQSTKENKPGGALKPHAPVDIHHYQITSDCKLVP